MRSPDRRTTPADSPRSPAAPTSSLTRCWGRAPRADCAARCRVGRAVEARGAAHHGFVVACDIPSGVDADTGEAHAPVLPADVTVTFGGAKAGLLADPGADFRRPGRGSRSASKSALPGPVLRRLGAEDLRPSAASRPAGAQILARGPGHRGRLRAVSRRRRAGLPGRPGRRRGHGPLPWPAARSRTWSATPAPKWSAAPVPWPTTTSRPGWWARAWMTATTSSCSGPALPPPSGLPVIADAGALPALPAVLAPHVVLTPHAGELAALLERFWGSRAGRPRSWSRHADAVASGCGPDRGNRPAQGRHHACGRPRRGAFSQADGHTLARHCRKRRRPGRRHRRPAGAAGGVGPVPFTARGIDPADRWAAIAALAASLHGRAGTPASRGAVR